jgi:hypothetical protein
MIASGNEETKRALVYTKYVIIEEGAPLLNICVTRLLTTASVIGLV